MGAGAAEDIWKSKDAISNGMLDKFVMTRRIEWKDATVGV